MKKTYTYSLLQYHHSTVMGEVLNIGVIIYFSITNEIRFIYPPDFKRIKNLYPDFPENTVSSYFDYFNARVKELNIKPEVFYKYELSRSLKKFIEIEFLPADSSMLQFRSYNKGISYTDNFNSLIKKLTKLYFPSHTIEYEISTARNTQLTKRNKEEWIVPDVKNKIIKIDKNDVFLPNQNDLSFLK